LYYYICVLILQSAAHARHAECGQTCLLIYDHRCVYHMCPTTHLSSYYFIISILILLYQYISSILKLTNTYLASEYNYTIVLIHTCVLQVQSAAHARSAECCQTNRWLCHTGTPQLMLLPICIKYTLHTHTHRRTQTHTHIRIHADVHRYVCMYINLGLFTFIYVHARAHTHTHTYLHR
jgi:hypothetical protein